MGCRKGILTTDGILNGPYRVSSIWIDGWVLQQAFKERTLFSES